MPPGDFSTALAAVGPQVEASISAANAVEGATSSTPATPTAAPTPGPGPAAFSAPAAPQPPSQTPTPGTTQGAVAAQTPPTPSPSPAAQPPSPASLDDNASYSWTDKDGSVRTLTGKQLREGTMMRSDYTAKTQATAELKKQAEGAIAAVQQLASDPAAFFRYGAERFGPQVAAQALQILQGAVAGAAPVPAANANELATVGQTQQLAQAYMQQALQVQQQQAEALKQQIQQAANQAAQGVRDYVEVQRYNDQLNPHVRALFEANPILSAVPHAEDLIRYKVLQREPATTEQAKQFFTEEGSHMASALLAKAQDLQKQQVVAQTALTTQGIMPPGGTPVVHQSQPQIPQLPGGRVDWNKLGDLITQDLSTAFSAQ